MSRSRCPKGNRMILNKWGCFPITRPSTDWMEDNQRMILTKPFVFIRPSTDKKEFARPVQIWMAMPGLEFDGESKPWWYWAVGGGRYQGPGRLAAIIHDEYCHRGRDLDNSPYDSGEVHRIYYEAARCAGLSAVRAETRYFGVRTGGPRFQVGSEVDVGTGEMGLAKPYTVEHLKSLAPIAFDAIAELIQPVPLTEESLGLIFK